MSDEKIRKVFQNDYNFKKPWRSAPASEKQINLIRKLGHRPPRTKGEASDLITALLSSKENERAIVASAREYKAYPTLGGGMVGVNHGVVDYIDDGNGSTWSSDDDDGEW